MKETVVVIRRLENELRTIRRQIDAETNPAKKAKMFSAYNKISRALTRKKT